MAGARYSASGNNTMTATPGDSALSIAGVTATLRRAWVNEFVIGNEGTPADNVVNYIVQRFTASGTDTAVTPTRLDVADAESDMNCGENHTVEPTYTATEELWEFPLNTRATYRWVAPPGGELVIPAVNEEGIGFLGFHASATTDYRATATWIE